MVSSLYCLVHALYRKILCSKFIKLSNFILLVRMTFLHTDIGSAKDNLKSPVHNWYKFTAGFSHKFVEEIINLENLKKKPSTVVFDPFAGCGTTLVSCQKEGVDAIGNEAQLFMYQIIKAKLGWKIDDEKLRNHLASLAECVSDKQNNFELNNVAHPLLVGLYSKKNLKKLYILKEQISNIEDQKYRLFLNLALSQTLHKVSLYPIAAPYISRNKKLASKNNALPVFLNICEAMLADTQELSSLKLTSKIYQHDSRKQNRFVDVNNCNVCITSPPYLNNLDYGEVSKVHSHFFDITNNWNDITKRVRKKLVTGSTTHYMNSSFSFEDYISSDFGTENKNLIRQIVQKSEEIKQVAAMRSGKKSFDILMPLYFLDMYLVIKEIRRVLKKKGAAYLILGDSAPYGVRIPTTEILGRIAKNVGFNSYEIHKIRTRGTKWKTLKNRHSLELTENVLVLK